MVKQALLYGPHKTYRYCCGSLYMEMFVGKKEIKFSALKIASYPTKKSFATLFCKGWGVTPQKLHGLTICRYLWSSPKYFLWKRRVDWQRVCWSFEQIWAMGIVDMADHESAHTPTCWSTFAFYNFLHFQSHSGPGLFMIMFRTSSWANALVTLSLLLSFTGPNFNLVLKSLGFQFSLTQPPIIT